MTIRTNLSERLREGRQLARQKHREGDAAKLGTLRAGNSGIMSSTGDIAGACHRLAHLRSLGINVDEPDDSKLIMFQMGTANEDVIYADLLHTAMPDEVILREEQIPTAWFTKSGTKVTGRPDLVVCKDDPEGKHYAPVDHPTALGRPVSPVYGVEIKSVASVWTSRDVLGDQKPKTENLIQAAHYSWQIGVPFRLMYKQYSIQEIPQWALKLFPKAGEPGSEYIDYQKGRIQPYEIVYELEFSKVSSGRLRYRREPSVSSSSPRGNEVPGRREGSADWVSTLITTDDIERYYEFVSRMAETGDLGSRPMNIGPDGKEKNWSRCDPKYCPLAGVCDRKEKQGYASWLAAVKQEMGK